jgi:hypothetical protein
MWQLLHQFRFFGSPCLSIWAGTNIFEGEGASAATVNGKPALARHTTGIPLIAYETSLTIGGHEAKSASAAGLNAGPS